MTAEIAFARPTVQLTAGCWYCYSVQTTVFLIRIVIYGGGKRPFFCMEASIETLEYGLDEVIGYQAERAS